MIWDARTHSVRAASRLFGVVDRPAAHLGSPVVGGRGIEIDRKIFDPVAYNDPQETGPGLMEDLAQLYHLPRWRGNLIHVKAL